MSGHNGILGLRKPLLVACAALFGACDTDQSVFFQLPIDGVPGVADLGEVVPAPVMQDLLELPLPAWPGVGPNDNVDVLNNAWREATLQRVLADLHSKVIFGELGPTGSFQIGGATLDFVGTGNSVCVWVDPELVSWSQSVSPVNPDPDFLYPDNLFDDGDIDLDAGPSVFYTGTPGETMGQFRANFEDELGVSTVVDLSSCSRPAPRPGVTNAFAGRGTPEFCSVADTIPGRRYTITLESFSLPLDDTRLGFGMLVLDGGCDEFDSALAGLTNAAYRRECVINGESIVPGQEQGAAAIAAGLGGLTWLADEVAAWPRSVEFEKSFCHIKEGTFEPKDRVGAFCEEEALDVLTTGDACSWQFQPTSMSGESRRCYCGDDTNRPGAGAF